MRTRFPLASCVLAAIFPTAALATVYNATPSNYTSLMAGLRPGDTLSLAPGTYPRLNVNGLRGTAAAWITITGPASGAPATIVGAACCNTVEIFNSSYVAIQNLTIDSLGIDGVAGISAKDGSSNLTHDILIQNNILVGQNSSQQTDGISTKTPTWGWIIRKNTIIGAGTGMYLGDSNGGEPFVAGIIENNLIQDTIGYNMQIKYQLPRPNVAGMPTGQSVTIIRDNVFIKNDQPSPDGDRPNVLVGGFPDSGPGSTDMYEVYGNFFYHNPREALFQASGRVSLHDNIFVDANHAAAVLQNHDLPLKLAYVYNNTVYTAGRGIYFGSAPSTDQAVVANLVFGASPITGAISNSANNIVDTLANASQYVVSPSFLLGAMDFYPQAGKVRGAVFDLSKFTADPDYSIDFNRIPKNSAVSALVFRGAYAGEGVNPGWKLQAALKNSGAAAPGPSLTGLQCLPPSLSSGQQSNCTVSLSSAASTNISVSLMSGNPLVSVPPSVSVAAGSATGSFTATAGTISSNGSAALTATLSGSAPVTTTLTLTAPAGSGSLAGSIGTPAATVNLTAEGTSDWAHWGLAAATSFNHKSGTAQQIGNFTLVGSGAAKRYANNPTGFTWTDGTTTASAAGTATGDYVAGQGNGFQITAPADTTLRTLRVYVALYASQGRMLAHLSDGSAPDYLDTSFSAAGLSSGVYTLAYKAASSSQTLTVTWTQTGTGNVALNAATLAGQAAPQDFSITAAPSSRTVTAGTGTTYTATISAIGGFSGTVGFSVTGLPPGATSGFSPSSVTGSGASTLTLTTSASTSAASYPLTITATSGALSHSANVTLNVTSAGGTGSLSGALATPSATVNLTAEGTSDWGQWGFTSPSDFNHKAGVAQAIAMTPVGGVSPARYGNNPTGFTWTDGTPAGSASNTTTGIYLAGTGRGFQITVPADTTMRTLRVYVALYASQGQMTAHLSDGSSTDFLDASFGTAGLASGVYTLTYKAASNGQTLTVTWTQTGNGNVALNAATLH